MILDHIFPISSSLIDEIGLMGKRISLIALQLKNIKKSVGNEITLYENNLQKRDITKNFSLEEVNYLKWVFCFEESSFDVYKMELEEYNSELSNLNFVLDVIKHNISEIQLVYQQFSKLLEEVQSKQSTRMQKNEDSQNSNQRLFSFNIDVQHMLDSIQQRDVRSPFIQKVIYGKNIDDFFDTISQIEQSEPESDQSDPQQQFALEIPRRSEHHRKYIKRTNNYKHRNDNVISLKDMPLKYYEFIGIKNKPKTFEQLTLLFEKHNLINEGGFLQIEKGWKILRNLSLNEEAKNQIFNFLEEYSEDHYFYETNNQRKLETFKIGVLRQEKDISQEEQQDIIFDYFLDSKTFSLTQSQFKLDANYLRNLIYQVQREFGKLYNNEIQMILRKFQENKEKGKSNEIWKEIKQ